MTTIIEKEFIINEPIEKVWSFVSDPVKIVECVPGASITEKVDDSNCKGIVSATFGPVKASYNGTITIIEIDSSNYKMKMNGKGLDSKGKGSADMVMSMELRPNENTTTVKFNTEISIAGMLAQFGSRLIGDVSNQLFNRFVENLKSRLAGTKVDNTVSGTAMMGTVLKSTLGGIFGGEKKQS